jgi:hypothetical protein
MAKQPQQPDLPFVSMLTDDEIAQAIANFAAKKQMGLDPEAHNLDFKVTYRQVKGDGGQRLFASIAITSVGAIAPPKEEPK